LGETLEQQAKREVETALEAVPIPKSRALACVALRLAGASYSAIADIHELGSPAIARQVVEEALAASVDEQRDIPKMRALTSLRLERLLQSVWGPATDAKDKDHLNYSRTALAIVDRLSKLHGTDAPQRLEVSTPDVERKEAWLRLAMERVGGLKGIEAEADIIDAEVVEGDN
jgi:hypothetical protein